MSLDLRTVSVVNVRSATAPDPRTKSTEYREPIMSAIVVDPAVAGGQALEKKLRQRDAASGKRLFYTVDEWAALSDAEKLEACDLSPRANARTAQETNDLVNAFDNADPLVKKGLIDRLKAALLADGVSVRGKRGAKDDKPAGE
jgi:hypothetical protein